MEFKPFEEADVETIRPFIEAAPDRFSDETLGDMLMWRQKYKTAYAIIQNTLIVKEEYEPGKIAFLYPIGPEKEAALDALDETCLLEKELPAFFAVSLSEAEALMQYYCHFHCLSDRGWSDYLYLLSDLRDLPGKKYDSKRHNVHSFWKNNPTVQFHLLEEKDLPLFVDFESAYLAENSGRDIDQTEFEYSRQMLRRFQIIPAKVGYFTLEGKVIGYSFGEVRGDTLFLHIEKALHAYPGIYQALESRFLQEFPASVIYVNREDDANNLGLREAKLQLHPCAILDKCFFEVLSPIDLVKSLPTLQGKSVYLAPLKKEEEEDWAKLNLDDELNRYWGYDYRCDLPKGVIPYAAYFAADLAHDFLDKNGISLFVHDLAGTFLGEVTLYHFTNDKGAEMGIRLKKEAQKHGFAFETVNLVIAYAQTVLGLRYLNYESFLQNAPSIHLAEKAGFEEVYQDRLKRHFRKLL